MVLVKITPVILMVTIGVLCRKKKIISREGISGLKTLATGFMLPILLFHTLATTTYTENTFRIVIVMFFQLCISFLLGMFLKKVLPSLGSFLPFIVSGFEGGMLGYPLYTVLCGEKLLSNIATLDIANTIFVFTIFLAMLMSIVSGSFEIRGMVSNVLHSPVFWGVFLGIFTGILGVTKTFLTTSAGQIYLASKDMLVSAISAIILIVVGYGLSLDKSVIKECVRAVAARIMIQGLLLFVTLFLLKRVLVTAEAQIALILYSFLPPAFVVPVYAKTEIDSVYLSTTISIYAVITIVVFAILTALS